MFSEALPHAVRSVWHPHSVHVPLIALGRGQQNGVVMGKSGQRGKQGKRLGKWAHLKKKDFTSWLDSTGTTAAALAKQLGVSPGLISSWKSGRRFPSEVNQLKLAEIVQGSPSSSIPPPADFDPERFRAWRKGRGLSRKALAAELGVSAGSIAGWEHGKTTPRASTLAKVQRVIEAKGLLGATDTISKAASRGLRSGGEEVAAFEAAGRVLVALVGTRRIGPEEAIDLVPRLRDAFLSG